MEPRRARLRQNHRLVDRWNQNLKELCIASISRDPDRYRGATQSRCLSSPPIATVKWVFVEPRPAATARE